MKKRVFSGIRATGRLHLGNWLGAVKGMLSLQDNPEYETLYGVVDLHTMTTPYDKQKLAKTAREVVMDYLACGLDPDKSIIVLQSQVADIHCELMFYFSTVVSVARMQHLPTYKDKVKQYPHHTTMALLNYPILMAADILAYKASKVPVGIDQEPHLEVAREIARKMNSAYGTDFPEPTRFATKVASVPSLTGEGKMSKSVPGSYINLTDDLDTIKKNLAKVPTDFGGPGPISAIKTGGVAALLKLVELFQGKNQMEAYKNQYLSVGGLKYQEIKQELADAIYQQLKPIQTKRKAFEANPEKVSNIIEQGAAKARRIASQTLAEVKKAMAISSSLG